jgi:hypothetical protein
MIWTSYQRWRGLEQKETLPMTSCEGSILQKYQKTGKSISDTKMEIRGQFRPKMAAELPKLTI